MKKGVKKTTKEKLKGMKNLYLKSPQARIYWDNLTKHNKASDWVEHQLLFHFSGSLTKDQTIKCLQEELKYLSIKKTKDENKLNDKYDKPMKYLFNKIKELNNPSTSSLLKERGVEE